jgi:hypothetical protein
VTTPSSIVRDLDPGVERVILRCLDRDPDKRPASALAVAAALPGGDPLAAALAAAETPSPEVRTWLASILGAAILIPAAGGGVPAGGFAPLYYLTQTIAVALVILAIYRYGLLVSAVMVLVDNIPSAVPIVPNGASWASMPGTLSIALVVALACFGFYAARAGQPLLGKIGDMAEG